MHEVKIRSRGGGFVNLPVPLPGQVDVLDIAHSLSNQCRCNGHTRVFFSVAQHSVEVATLCYREANRRGLKGKDRAGASLAGLLHDAPEYLTGDVISPVKRRLGEAYRELDREVSAPVFEALGVTELMERHAELVRWADLEMLASDMARWGVIGNIVSSHGDEFVISQPGRVPPPFKLRFGNAVPMQPVVARNMFMNLYASLRRELDTPTVVTASS
jgi:hypothetical protein